MQPSSFRPLLGFLTFVLLSVLGGCVGGKQDRPSGPIQVKIPLLTDGTYQFQVVDLLTVEDLVELKGWAARFLLSPTQSGKSLDGYQPKIRAIKSTDGTYIATDELSLQLLTIYYHMENLGMLDELVGAVDVNAWPRTVGVNVNYMSKDSDGARAENNALYSGDLDAFLFVPYTEGSLPIMVNGGIIGHEHFHSLFHKLFVKPLGETFPGGKPTLHQEDEKKLKAAFGIVDHEPVNNSSSDREPMDEKPVDKIDRSLGDRSIVRNDDYHSFLLRGLNEGLADFWGWLYSMDTDFVGQSLPRFSAKRKLEGVDIIPSDYCFSLSLTYNAERDKEYPGPVAKAYKYGTSVARNLKAFSLDYQKQRGLSPLQMKARIGSAVLKSIIKLRQAYVNLAGASSTSAGETLGTHQFFEILASNLDDITKEESEALKPTVKISANKEDRVCR